MITYTMPWPGLDVKIPKLHRVNVPWFRQYDTDYDTDYILIRAWCEGNCREGFYMTPGWSHEQGVQFEDSDDAEDFEKWVTWQTLARL